MSDYFRGVSKGDVCRLAKRNQELLEANKRMISALTEIANQGPNYGPDGTMKTWVHWSAIAKNALKHEVKK
jgi:hypothetical protein